MASPIFFGGFMARLARGEVNIKIGGKSHAVAMGLGALAEIQDELGIDDFQELGEKLSSPSPKMLMGFMRAILKGNDVPFEESELKKLDLSDVMSCLNKLIERSSFGGAEDGDDAQPEDDGQGNLLAQAAE